LAEQLLALPEFKGRPGWEFTDLSGLALGDYTAAPLSREGGVEALWQFDASELPAGVEVTVGEDGSQVVTVGGKE